MKKIILTLLVGFFVGGCSSEDSLLEKLNIDSQEDIVAIEAATGDGSKASLYNGAYLQGEFVAAAEGACGQDVQVGLSAGRQALIEITESGNMRLNLSKLGDYSGALSTDGSFLLLAGQYTDEVHYFLNYASGRFYEENGVKKAEIEIEIEVQSPASATIDNEALNCRIASTSKLILVKQ